MKGIVILGFSKVTGSYLDVQYPENIYRKLEVEPSILLRLLEENREKKMSPNFAQTVIKKDLSAAYFYTGFSQERFVGREDYTIVVFMTEDEILPKTIEGMIRRLAQELLPQRGKLTFNALLTDYFELLKKGELEPYWEENIKREGEEIVIVPIKASKREVAGLKASILDEEILDLKKQLEEKNNKIEIWSIEFADLNENNGNLMQKIKDLNEKITRQAQEIESQSDEVDNFKEEIEQYSKQAQELEKRDQEINELNENLEKVNIFSKELEERKFQEITDLKNNLESVSNENTELETKLNMQLSELNEKQKELEKIKTENDDINQILENLKKDFDEMKNATEKLKVEKESFLDTITGLKLDLKKAREQNNAEQDDQAKIKEEIIDMKKEIKVLRRERDHYQKMVKDNNLL